MPSKKVLISGGSKLLTHLLNPYGHSISKPDTFPKYFPLWCTCQKKQTWKKLYVTRCSILQQKLYRVGGEIKINASSNVSRHCPRKEPDTPKVLETRHSVFLGLLFFCFYFITEKSCAWPWVRSVIFARLTVIQNIVLYAPSSFASKIFPF